MTDYQGGPLTFFGELLIGVINLARGNGNSRAAEREARRAERRAREEWREWLAIVERQTARTSAGDATEDRAREVLGGDGRRRNPFDERRFR
jgi:hypothetical protein